MNHGIRIPLELRIQYHSNLEEYKYLEGGCIEIIDPSANPQLAKLIEALNDLIYDEDPWEDGIKDLVYERHFK